jgi:hypothetical protein
MQIQLLAGFGVAALAFSVMSQAPARVPPVQC